MTGLPCSTSVTGMFPACEMRMKVFGACIPACTVIFLLDFLISVWMPKHATRTGIPTSWQDSVKLRWRQSESRTTANPATEQLQPFQECLDSNHQATLYSQVLKSELNKLWTLQSTVYSYFLFYLFLCESILLVFIKLNCLTLFFQIFRKDLVVFQNALDRRR